MNFTVTFVVAAAAGSDVMSTAASAAATAAADRSRLSLPTTCFKPLARPRDRRISRQPTLAVDVRFVIETRVAPEPVVADWRRTSPGSRSGVAAQRVDHHDGASLLG